MRILAGHGHADDDGSDQALRRADSPRDAVPGPRRAIHVPLGRRRPRDPRRYGDEPPAPRPSPSAPGAVGHAPRSGEAGVSFESMIPGTRAWKRRREGRLCVEVVLHIDEIVDGELPASRKAKLL